ncbi:MAG: hypothetical protein AAF725_24940 [Acidobacteriota bacterium]
MSEAHALPWADLLKALDPDPQAAAERLAALLDKLQRIFEWRGAQDPREAAYEVVDRVAQKIKAGITLTTTVEGYASGFVRPVFMEGLRKLDREESTKEELKYEAGWDQIPDAREDWLACLDLCCESILTEDERNMLMLFHAHQGKRRIETRARLAEARGKTANALRIDAHRLRKRLKKCVAPCVAARADK